VGSTASGPGLYIELVASVGAASALDTAVLTSCWPMTSAAPLSVRRRVLDEPCRRGCHPSKERLSEIMNLSTDRNTVAVVIGARVTVNDAAGNGGHDHRRAGATRPDRDALSEPQLTQPVMSCMSSPRRNGTITSREPKMEALACANKQPIPPAATHTLSTRTASPPPPPLRGNEAAKSGRRGACIDLPSCVRCW
jgi:hypothetical protein